MAVPKLEIVASDFPDPPYEHDVMSRGWGFVLEPQRIESSTTWTLCPLEMRAYLLLLWFKAWQQTPCGSLPDDDEELAALIGLSPNVFATHRKALMRGWAKHSDMRLYHNVISGKVVEMMGSRRRDRERKSLTQKISAGIQRIPPDSAAGTGTGTGTGTGNKDKSVVVAIAPTLAPEKRLAKKATRLPEGWFLPDEWRDWAVTVCKVDAQRAVRVSLDFRDYWHAKAGAQACKLDWFATWRRWMRKESGNA